MFGQQCKYDKEFTCFHMGKCDYEGLISCLKNSLIFLTREMEQLKYRQMQKHTAASIKWRNKSFYYMKKVKALELYLLNAYNKVPSSKELRSPVKGNFSNLPWEENGMVVEEEHEKG